MEAKLAFVDNDCISTKHIQLKNEIIEEFSKRTVTEFIYKSQ